MEKYFRKEDGNLCNVIEHCIEQLNIHPSLKVYIATDSQVHKKTIAYATCIVFRYGTNGAHYIYNLDLVPRKRVSMFERLFDEAQRTIDTALMIRDSISLSIEALEFDYNNIKKTESTALIATAKGWALGLGYNPVFKGGQMIAAKAADHICRKKSS